MALTLSKTSMIFSRSESALVSAARAGDDRAFELLYSKYRDRILAYIVSRVRDHGRAEDIAQEVFISALRRLRASDQEIAFKPWIYEIAKNACIDEFRRGSRAHEVPLETDADLPVERPTTLTVLPTPIAAVENKQRMSDLRGAFGGLSENHHQLLVMREFEGRSYDEIGEKLDMTRQMVESSLFRARRKLTEEYQDLASGRRCEQVQVAIDTGEMSSARSLGLRDRRRYARHLSHCQVCRQVALQADVDEVLVQPRSIAARIAALLPLPPFLWRWPWSGRGRGGARTAGGSHHVMSGSLQNAATMAEPAAGSALTLGPAAVTAAALAIAGVGGGLLHGAIASGHGSRAVTAVSAAAIVAPAQQTGRSVLTSSPSVPVALNRAAAARHAAAAPATIRFSGTGSVPIRATRGRHGRSSATGAPGSRDGSTRNDGTTAAKGATHRSIHVPATGPATLGSTVRSTAQHVVSTTNHLVSNTGKAVSKVGSAVATSPMKALQGLVNTVTGAASPAGQSSGSTASSAPTLSSTLQSVKQALAPSTPGQ